MTRPSNAGLARQALKSAISADHERVDDLFAQFRLSDADSYGAFLRAHMRALAPLEAIADVDAPRLPLLKADLAALASPVPENEVSPLASDNDAFRWGVRYALEGSRLGGAYLARQVPDDLPRAYLSAVHEKGGWAAFQTQLDDAAQLGGGEWIEQAVDGARHAFSLFEAGARSEGAGRG